MCHGVVIHKKNNTYNLEKKYFRKSLQDRKFSLQQTESTRAMHKKGKKRRRKRKKGEEKFTS